METLTYGSGRASGCDSPGLLNICKGEASIEVSSNLETLTLFLRLRPIGIALRALSQRERWISRIQNISGTRNVSTELSRLSLAMMLLFFTSRVTPRGIWKIPFGPPIVHNGFPSLLLLA